MLLARLLVLSNEKHNSAVYPITPQMEPVMSLENEIDCTKTA